jgi:hypothetical protein
MFEASKLPPALAPKYSIAASASSGPSAERSSSTLHT